MPRTPNWAELARSKKTGKGGHRPGYDGQAEVTTSCREVKAESYENERATGTSLTVIMSLIR